MTLKNGNTLLKIFLMTTLIFGTSCDPGWHLMLREPSSQIYNGKQTISVNDLTISTKAYFFSLGSNINFDITTGKEKTVIVPQFAFVTSLMNSNKSRIPYDVTLTLNRMGKQVYKHVYSIKDLNESKTREITINEWIKNRFRIYLSANNGAGSTTKTVTKKEYLAPVILHKDEILNVHFRFIGFGSCSKSIGFDPPCQDITLHYNIFDTKRPLKLIFVSGKNR